MDDTPQKQSYISKLNNMAKDLNSHIKPISESLSIWLIIISLAVVLISYIVLAFIAKEPTWFNYVSGFGLIIVCTIILYLFVNLCLNYQNSRVGVQLINKTTMNDL